MWLYNTVINISAILDVTNITYQLNVDTRRCWHSVLQGIITGPATDLKEYVWIPLTLRDTRVFLSDDG